jgi:hypothetical protein
VEDFVMPWWFQLGPLAWSRYDDMGDEITFSGTGDTWRRVVSGLWRRIG